MFKLDETGKETRPQDLLRNLREERKLSQRELAARLGIEKTRVSRLEKKNWKAFSFEELEMFSRGFSMEFNELLSRFLDQGSPRKLIRHSLRSSRFLPGGEAFLLSLIFKKETRFSAARLSVAPGKSFRPPEDLASGSMVFYLVVEGVLTLYAEGKDFVFHEKEAVQLNGNGVYELSNPSSVKPLTLFALSF